MWPNIFTNTTRKTITGISPLFTWHFLRLVFSLAFLIKCLPLFVFHPVLVTAITVAASVIFKVPVQLHFVKDPFY